MHRWKLSILAAAAVMSAGLYATDANALALGRLTVQSALGEPLRAEIELPQITAAEADSLRAAPASPQVFRAQGMEVSPALNTLRVQLQRRSDGSMVLQLTSDRPVNDPFVDLVLDATWNSGQIVRSYTMLFDPPALRRPPATVTASPQVTAPAPIAAAPATRTPRNTESATSQAASPAASPRPAAAPRPAPAPAPAAAPAATGGTVTVQAGDTAGRLAAANRPAGVSLDQMLVAMMRSNPDAFIRGNVNRLKSGAVLQLPDETQARATPPGEARQIIAAQSRDFNDFRRRLAGAAPSAEVAAAERSASGKVQAQVEDKKPATAAPDKLTLSKGAMQGQKAAEDQVAKDKQASAASARMAELSKNISDLNKLGTASAPVAAGTGAPAAAASAATGATVATGAVVPTAAAPAPQAAASAASAPAAPATPVATAPASDATSAASESAAAASAPVVAAAPQPAPAAVPAPAPAPEEPGFLSSLFDDPILPLAGGALLALLLGYGAYRTVQNRRNNQGVDSSFMESKLQPDSFFGASGGQRVDTASSQLSTGSSMAYSPSQLDAGGDVDPVAEADVYLAYGRDLQAEEILKEAVRHNPDRTSVHVKLGEIYAKRQDRKALEAVAQDVFKLTDGQGPDWARVAELGRELDPENPLYQPGGRPGLAGLDDDGPNAGNDFASTFTGGRPQAASATSAALPPDMDLDLDLDLPGDALTEAPPAPPAAPGAFAAAAAAAGAAAGVMAAAPAMAREPAPVPDYSEPPALDMGALELPDPSWDKPVTTAAAPLSPTPASADLEFPDDLRLMDSAPAPLSSPPDAAASGPAPLEFDLGALSLDLDSPGASGQAANAAAQELPQATPALPDDPLATKLALAEEFNAIGDSEGARTLIEEVIAESSGALKTRAQRLLSELG